MIRADVQVATTAATNAAEERAASTLKAWANAHIADRRAAKEVARAARRRLTRSNASVRAAVAAAVATPAKAAPAAAKAARARESAEFAETAYAAAKAARTVTREAARLAAAADRKMA